MSTEVEGISYNKFTGKSKNMRDSNFPGLKAVMNTVKGVLSHKQCKIQMLLQQTINRQCYMVYQILKFLMTLNDEIIFKGRSAS